MKKRIHHDWRQWGPETGWIIFQSILCCVEENKEMFYAFDLEQCEFKYLMTVSLFLGEVSF